jgi:tetratricopeptide (TPR) repeat protein
MVRVRTDDAQFSAFRRLIRDARYPSRLRSNPLATAVCSVDPPLLAGSFLKALQISLHRLTLRQRIIISRYDLGNERIEDICKTMGLSRRQFFRDHRAALARLSALMMPEIRVGEHDSVDRCVAAGIVTVTCYNSSPPLIALVDGLRNTGAFAEAISVLSRIFGTSCESHVKIDAALGISEIAIEFGDLTIAREALVNAKTIANRELSALPARLDARLTVAEGHLALSHRERQEKFEKAVATLARAGAPSAGDENDARLLANALHSLSLSHDHCGDWLAARDAARRSISVVTCFDLVETPIGLLAAANYAMRDARQFGNVDAALEKLRWCLAVALRNGWVLVTGDIAVHFMNLNLMRSRYTQALAWHRWIIAIDSTRLGARTRNFLAVDSAHALTMLGRPGRALAILKQDGDEGLAFAGAREYWRGEALQAAGDSEWALRLAAKALEGATLACTEKGKARSMRLLANCHHALGHVRVARRIMSECLELSERYVSPYDLLLSLAVARRIERPNADDETELARLLRGAASEAEYGPPSR